MLRRFHPFCAGQSARQHLRIVDQHRHVLRTDPEFLIPVCKGNERDLFLRLFADEAVFGLLRHRFFHFVRFVGSVGRPFLIIPIL